MNRSAVPSIAAAALLALVLVGCTESGADTTAPSSSSTNDSTNNSTDEPTEELTEASTEEPTADPTESPSAQAFLAMDPAPTFDAGLPQIIEWLPGEDGWTLTSPDIGEGHWGYTETATGCTADFFQNQLTPAAMAAGGDDAATLQHLSDWLSAPLDQVVEFAKPYDVGTEATIGSGFETRAITLSNDSFYQLVLGRSFTESEAGFVISLKCDTVEQNDAAASLVLLP